MLRLSVTDLAPVTPLMVVGARRVDRGSGRRVGKDVNQVWIHHVIIEQVKETHPV